MTVVSSADPPREVYVAGFSGTVAVPNDVNYVCIRAQGAGGGGLESPALPLAGAPGGPGGGGGGYSYAVIPVLSTEWGTNLTLSVGSGVSGAAGGDSTITGTLNGAAVSITAGGGQIGSTSAPFDGIDGAGGTASGGDTNNTGTAGAGYSPNIPHEDGLAGEGGASGGSVEPDCIDYTAGTGANGTAAGSGTAAGEGGYIALEWY